MESENEKRPETKLRERLGRGEKEKLREGEIRQEKLLREVEIYIIQIKLTNAKLSCKTCITLTHERRQRSS